MQILSRTDLSSLEQYAVQRAAFRAQVIAHKKNRQIPIGPNATLYFEDRLTMQYQIQEMLRIERIFEAAAIQEELDTYNPMIPDGQNWKATFMFEFADAAERQPALVAMRGIEDRVWVKIGAHPPVFAIADEDLERTSSEKTASVHFLRFELPAEAIQALKAGAALSLGIDHPAYTQQCAPLAAATREALLADLA